MHWLICGTVPDPHFPLCHTQWSLHNPTPNTPPVLKNEKGEHLSVQRGTPALIASALAEYTHLHAKHHPHTHLEHIPITALLVGDVGDGLGSKALYAYLANTLLPQEHFTGITFHYLFPDVDGHNRILMAYEALEHKPLLIADAGFMYVAKMSGYADSYDLFTPDIGEMAFLADETAPHPFYTRGFLLANNKDVPQLLQKAASHKNIAKHLIIKGSTDYIVRHGQIISHINSPSQPAMEAIGGTGDLVTGLATAHLMFEHDIATAAHTACQRARHIAMHAQPTPATQIGEILQNITTG